MPIPWTAIRLYAREQGVRGKDNINHFCRLVMAADDEFRAAINERLETAKEPHGK